MSKTRYTISEAADAVQVENHVLRYWEDELDLTVPRNDLGHRYYTKENIDEFVQIQKWKEDGYQLKAIKTLLHPEDLKPKETTTQMTEVKAAPVTAATSSQLKMEQFQNILTDIVRNVIEENNPQLGKAVSEQVGDKVLKEMNYLMREQDEMEEERYKKLDASIREHQNKNAKKEPKRKWFGRKTQTT